MWKQAVLRIWMENKGIPLCFKIPTILLMIFGEIFLNEIPYMIILALGVPFIETTLDVTLSSVEDFLPRTGSQRKRMDIRESILIAGIYTLAITLGYVLLFCLYERYPWEGETIFFLVKITVSLFLILFSIRMCFIQAVVCQGERAAYILGGDFREWERRAKRGAAKLLGVLYCSYAGMFYLSFYTLGMFCDIKLFKFLVGSQWKFAYAIDGIVFVLLCIQTVWILRQKYER